MRTARVGRLVSLALAAGCVAHPGFGGPLPVRNNHPGQLTVLHLPVARAATLPAGETAVRVSAAYTSLFLRGADPSRSFYMDGEYLRVRPSLRVGLGAGLDLEAAVPFAHTSGGFLDSFVIDYHDLFGFPDQDRSLAPRDDFRIEATRDGGTVWAVEKSGFEMLDVPLVLSWCAIDPDAHGYGLALRTGLELPTGDETRGYGNGEVDWSVGVTGEVHLDGVACYAHVQHTFAGSPDQGPGTGLEFADVTTAGLGLEVPLTECLHGFVQTEFETSTLRKLGLRQVTRDHLLLWFGGRLRLPGRFALEVAFGEDLHGNVSPDFTAWLGFAYAPWAGASRPAAHPGLP